MRSRSLRRSIAVAALLLLTACGSSETSSPSSTATPVGDAAAPGGVPAALDFTAALVGGGEFSGAEVAGKPTAFWFWAPT